MDILLKNNTGNQDKQTLINGFVVRLKVLNNFLNELKLSKSNKPEQNYLIIGQRGAGKTTLLHRLKYAIEDDAELKERIIPIIFNEEQYHLTELINLWETVAEYLDEIDGFSGIADMISEQVTGSRYDEERTYDLLELQLKASDKKVILFIENLDVLLRKFGKDGQQRLREVLSTSTYVRIIGSSTTYFDGIINYTDPFYDFFKIIQLNGLSKQETYKLLLKIADQTNEVDKVQFLLRRSKTRVEALRRLTGGNPRMMAYLYQIFLDNANGKAIKDLYKLLDDLTFLYKSELDQLSTQQQKIVDIIARNWDAISVKEIAVDTRMESKHISSVLNMLEKNQVIERISTKTKNNLYRLKDRFLNIWYLMRFGKKRDQENILWLVRFYDAWCDKTELSERVMHYINNLLGGEYDNMAAVDMVNTFLSCKNVSPLVKYRLFKTSQSTLPKDLIKALSENDWFETIKGLVRAKKYEQAIDALHEMGDKGVLSDTIGYWIYINKEEYVKAAEYLASVFDYKQDSLTAHTLAELYETRLKTYDKAIYYYDIALDGKRYKAAYSLGQIYQFVIGDKLKAIEYYKLAIKHGVHEAIMALATLNFTIGNYSEAKRLCLMAIENGDTKAYINLSVLYQQEGKNSEAIEVLEKAIQAGEDFALLSLGDLYLDMTKPFQLKAKRLYQEAVDKEVPDAHYALGRYLLYKEKNVIEAVKILKKGIRAGDEDAAHLLGHHFMRLGDYSQAEEMFVKSFDMGHVSSLLCLANGAFRKGLTNRRAFILELFESKMAPYNEPITLIEYCKVLVWNERFEDSFNYLLDAGPKFQQVFKGDSEDYKESLISRLTSYFIRLTAYKQYNLVNRLFMSESVDYKQILKPVYYAVMRSLKDEYPNEYLKAGAEMNETIEEILTEIEEVRSMIV
ncbi:hypothetical protein DBR11_03395 [Pedobacter sp. HMWF019]|uniref:tetratricopeptide repeat protein n=1 Tax=Pedobacter sp. HMWF019 TaxID=2056856 RepID=UPI000D3C6901|nr:tetratricopeptide repeat protein [Pedobacter sp. HMWF019]PTT03058.1 hypothetical protein DBR11_03395 [Pedobacter sp. HMWF019]